MNPYENLDTLYDFLKSITSVDEFFAKKEPDLNDDTMKAFVEECRGKGIMTEESILYALKSTERQRMSVELEKRRVGIAH